MEKCDKAFIISKFLRKLLLEEIYLLDLKQANKTFSGKEIFLVSVIMKSLSLLSNVEN